jgi:hypothetical protein
VRPIKCSAACSLKHVNFDIFLHCILHFFISKI